MTPCSPIASGIDGAAREFRVGDGRIDREGRLEEEDVELFQFAADPRRGRHVVEEVADIDHQRGLVAERLAKPAGEFDHVARRRHHRLDLECAIAQRRQPFGAADLLREHRLAAPHVRDERAIRRDRDGFSGGRLERPALDAAEQFPHRPLQHLAVDVPDGDIERAEDDDLPAAAVGVHEAHPTSAARGVPGA